MGALACAVDEVPADGELEWRGLARDCEALGWVAEERIYEEREEERAH